MNKTGRQVITGLIIALVSLGIVLGGFSMSMAETGMVASPTDPPVETTQASIPAGATSTLEPQIITPTWTPTLLPSPTLQTGTPTPTFTATTARTTLPWRTSTLFPCEPHPSTWVTYMVQPHDTLYSLGRTFNVHPDDLQKYNCIPNPNVLPAWSIIYVPDYPLIYPTTPTNTDTPIPVESPTDDPATEEPIATEPTP